MNTEYFVHHLFSIRIKETEKIRGNNFENNFSKLDLHLCHRYNKTNFLVSMKNDVPFWLTNTWEVIKHEHK